MSVIILLTVIFAIVTKNSFGYSSQSETEIANAKVSISQDLLNQNREIYTSVDYDTAIGELKMTDYIFLVECIDMEICYNCIKYNMNVIKTIKGDTDETSKDIVLYQLSVFDFSNDTVTFTSADNTIPLKSGDKYLIFASKRDYYKDYQNSLDKNEYSLSLTGMFPTAIVVDKTQDEFINYTETMTYSQLENYYYICFDKESLDNINRTANQIIEHYIDD